MKLEISKLKLLWAFLCDGAAGIGSYLLTSLNTALQNLSTTNKASVQAVLNYATKIAATLEAFGWLIPTKWQTAYKSSIAAVKEAIEALGDLGVTTEELMGIATAFKYAVAAWQGDDDETCTDCVVEDDDFADCKEGEKECTDEA